MAFQVANFRMQLKFVAQIYSVVLKTSRNIVEIEQALRNGLINQNLYIFSPSLLLAGWLGKTEDIHNLFLIVELLSRDIFL